jgi:proteasome lid subunit RPN8/RPN11
VSPLLLPPQIRIQQCALAKLLLYAERCPLEIGGLGYVVQDEEGLFIPDLFVLPQKVSASDTELDPDALCEFLGRLVREDADVSSVRLWWHSHGDMDLVWSETDCLTIGGLPGDFWVAIVVNRRGEIRSRLDVFVPERQTWDVPLVEISGDRGCDPEVLRVAVDREIFENVRAYTVVQDVLVME